MTYILTSSCPIYWPSPASPTLTFPVPYCQAKHSLGQLSLLQIFCPHPFPWGRLWELWAQHCVGLWIQICKYPVLYPYQLVLSWSCLWLCPPESSIWNQFQTKGHISDHIISHMTGLPFWDKGLSLYEYSSIDLRIKKKQYISYFRIPFFERHPLVVY